MLKEKTGNVQQQVRHIPIPAKAQYLFSIALVAGASLLGAYLMSEQIPYSNGMDEAYYVTAARLMGVVKCSPSIDLACNLEHPPFAKMIAKASLYLTNNVRTFHILLSAATPVMVFVLANRLLGSQKAALLAGLILGLDGYYYYITATANLEAPMIAFSVAALLCYVFLEKRPRLRLAAVILLLSLSLFSKYAAAFDVFAIAGIHFIRTRKLLQTVIIAILPFALSIIYLEPYDIIDTTFPNAISHIQWMIGFHVVASTTPGQLWLGDLKSWSPLNFFFMHGEVEGTDHKVGVLAASMGLTIPMAYLYIRRKGAGAQFSYATLICLAFFISFMVEMTLLHLDGRILYIYYLPEIMPIAALACGWLALFVKRSINL